MPKFTSSFEPSSSALTVKYLQNNSLILIRMTTVSQTSINEAQQSLLLDFNIRETAEQNKQWSGLQYRLKQLYSSVVKGSLIPGGIVKIWVWILMADEQLQSAIYNGVYIGFVKLGLPMQYCIYAITDKPASNNNNTTTTQSTSSNTTTTINKSSIKQTSIKNNTIILNIGSGLNYHPIYGKYCSDILQTKQKQLQKQINEYRNMLCLALNQEISK